MAKDTKLAKFVDIANDYGGIEYGCNCKIVVWQGDDAAIVTLEDQDDREAEQAKVVLRCDGKTYRVEDLEGNLLATTNYPRVLFAILYA
jgi:hypothetical protein